MTFENNIAVIMTKVVTKILLGSAVTQAAKGGIVMNYPDANFLFLYYLSARNHDNRLANVKLCANTTCRPRSLHTYSTHVVIRVMP